MTQTAAAPKSAVIKFTHSDAAPTQAPHESSLEPGFSADLDFTSEPGLPDFVTLHIAGFIDPAVQNVVIPLLSQSILLNTHEAIKKKTWTSSSERELTLQAFVEKIPLHLMKSIGCKENDYPKFYANYIYDTAHILHMNGVILGGEGDPEPEHRQMRQVVLTRSLEVTSKAGTPTAEQIGKSLHM